MSMINPSRCYFAVSNANRQTFANCFSGNLSEASIRLKDANGSIWWGANGSYDLIAELDRQKLALAQAWFCVIVFQISNTEVSTGIVLDSNCGYPVGMPDPGFDAFASACGLQLDPDLPFPNGTLS